jgi:hypothetical protein
VLVRLVHRPRQKLPSSSQEPHARAPQPCWSRALQPSGQGRRLSTSCIVCCTLLCATTLLAAAALHLDDSARQQQHQAARSAARSLRAAEQPLPGGSQQAAAGAAAAPLGSTTSAAAGSPSSHAADAAAGGSGAADTHDTHSSTHAAAEPQTTALPADRPAAAAPAPLGDPAPILGGAGSGKLAQPSAQDLLQVLAQLHDSWHSGAIRWPGRAATPAATSVPPNQTFGSQQQQVQTGVQAESRCADAVAAMMGQLTAMWHQTWQDGGGGAATESGSSGGDSAAAVRGAVEFTHVSKSGGSSICHLAAQSNCTSQSFKLHRNCLVEAFSDEPAWTLAPGTYLGGQRRQASALPCPAVARGTCHCRCSCSHRRSNHGLDPWMRCSQLHPVHFPLTHPWVCPACACLWCVALALPSAQHARPGPEAQA